MYSAIVESALQVLHTQAFNIRIPFSLKIVSNAVTHLIKVSFYSYSILSLSIYISFYIYRSILFLGFYFQKYVYFKKQETLEISEEKYPISKFYNNTIKFLFPRDSKFQTPDQRRQKAII